MSNDRIELLDRQYQRLASREGVAFIRELRAFHDFVTTTSPFDDILAELTAEAKRTIAEHAAHDDALIPEAVALRNELAQRAPEHDDSALAPPAERGPEDIRWMFSFANFDLVAANDDRGEILRNDDNTRSGMLLRVLRNRIDTINWYENPDDPQPVRAEAPIRPDLDDLALRLRNLEERHRHVVQAYRQAESQHGGFQMAAVNLVINEMNPAATVIENDTDQHAHLNDVFLRVVSGMYVVERAATPGETLSSDDEARLQTVINRLRAAVECVYEDLRLRAATRTSSSGTPGWLQAGFVTIGLLASVVALLLAPAWFAGLSIATIASAAVLHSRLWPWPPRPLAVAGVVAAALLGAAMGVLLDQVFDDHAVPATTATSTIPPTTTTSAVPTGAGQIEGGNIFRSRESTSSRDFDDVTAARVDDIVLMKIRLSNPGPDELKHVEVQAQLPRTPVARIAVTATAGSPQSPTIVSDTTAVVVKHPACLQYVLNSTELLDAHSAVITTLPDGITTEPIDAGPVDVPREAIRFVQFHVAVVDAPAADSCPK